MWDSKNDSNNVKKQIESVNAAEKVASTRLADKNKDI